MQKTVAPIQRFATLFGAGTRDTRTKCMEVYGIIELKSVLLKECAGQLDYISFKGYSDDKLEKVHEVNTHFISKLYGSIKST